MSSSSSSSSSACGARFYNAEGKVTTSRERARSAREMEGRVFARMVTSADTLERLEQLGRATSARSSKLLYRRPQTIGATVAGQPLTVAGPLQFQRVLAARATRNFQAKSARARLRTSVATSTGTAGTASFDRRRSSGGSSSCATSGDNDGELSSRDEPKPLAGLQDARDAENATTSGKEDEAAAAAAAEESDADSDSTCQSCLEVVRAQRSGVEKPQAAPGPTGKKPALKMAMADFTRKIEDNEGTEISTFSYIEEKQGSQLQQPESAEASADVTPSASLGDMSKESLKEAARKLHKHKQKHKHLTPLNRLRRAVKTVNLLIKACTTKEEQTRKNQMKMMTFSDIASNLAEESKNEDLNFQLSYFKAKKEMTLSVEAQEILRLHPFLRTKEMLHTAMVSLQTAVEAFSEFPLNMKDSLVKVGWYEKFHANQVIIRQGHNALNYYFIISGTTAVSVALKKPSGEPFNKTVAFLRKGESFGELALLYGGKRSATVYCKDEVELLAVSREDFIDIFMNLESSEEPEHISFLREISTLSGWPVNQLPYDNPKVCMFAYFRKGIVLCRDSNSSEFVYIIKSGHCLVMKDLQPSVSIIPKLRSRSRMCDSYPVEQDVANQRYLDFMHKDCLPDTKTSGGGVGGGDVIKKLRTSAGRVVIARPSGKLFVQLKVLQRRDTFGLEPIAFRVFGGTTGVTLVSMGAECILISKEFFLRHMTERYYQLLRREIQMFPTVESLNEKLQSYYNWDAYKDSLVNFLMRPRFID